jgi:hypothetical protein
LLVKDARPAKVDSSGSNQIESAERKTVTVTVAAAIDALQRSFFNSGEGVGLRAGTFHTDYNNITPLPGRQLSQVAPLRLM